MIGKSFSSYRILTKIGVGGMGEVYRAEDSTLRREVAIKVLPPHLLDDPERLARFEREAQVLASLDHPGIASVYGFEESEGNRFLIMELVEGEDLAQHLERGPIPPDDAIPIALQIAEALESAHEKGVIHRDLKPANIKLRPDGRIKVLDFGLAKAIEGEIEGGSNLTALPTLTGRMTAAHVILGTAAYMSPEQARGRAVDKRGDIWSYGCVLFELLSGKQAFQGETVSDTLASVLKSEPDWTELPASTPAHLRTLIERCLVKDPRQRLRDIGDARIQLEEGDTGSPVSAASAAAPRRGVPGWVAGLLALLVVASALLTRMLWPSPPAETVQGAILMPPGHSPIRYSGGHLAFSPDGRRIAFAAWDSSRASTLWIRNLTDSESHQLSGTEGAAYPFWSPDGRMLGFFADGKMKKIPVAGGAPVTICGAPSGRGATWKEDGTILFAPSFNSDLAEVSASGGEPVLLRTGGSDTSFSSFRWPQSIPGDGLLYTGLLRSRGTGLFYQPPGDTSRRVLESSSQGIYADRSVYYMIDDVLFARSFDARRGLFTGEPKTIATGVFLAGSYGCGAFTVAAGGNIAYMAGSRKQLDSRLIFDGRDGVRIDSHDLGAVVSDLALSPDGTRMAYSRQDPDSGEDDIWILDLGRDVQSRLTFTGDADDPVWSPDGTRLAYASEGNICIRSATGVGDEQTLSSTPDDDCTHDWSLDGRYLVWSRSRKSLDLVIYDLDRKEEKTLLKGHDYKQGRFSPDGRWIAYVSDESGRDEIYVRDFPDMRGRWQISGSGGSCPQWGAGEIVYLSGDGNILSVEVDTIGEALKIGRQRTLFSGNVRADRSIQMALAPGGAGIWFVDYSNSERTVSAPEPIRFILNWKGE